MRRCGLSVGVNESPYAVHLDMPHRESVPNLKLQFQVIKWNYKRFLDEELLKSSQLVEEEKKFEENNMVFILLCMSGQK